MRRVTAMLLLFALPAASCATETTELFPDEDAAAQSRDAAPARDTGAGADVTLADATAPDAEQPDAGQPDAAVAQRDAAPPDAVAAACVCRFLSCTLDAECLRAIGPSSTCVMGSCTGGAQSCRSNRDCDPPSTCAAGIDSTDPC